MKKQISEIWKNTMTTARAHSMLTLFLVLSMVLNMGFWVQSSFWGIQSSAVAKTSSWAIQSVESSKVESSSQSGVADSTFFTSLESTQPGVISSAIDALQVYSQSCAVCHGQDRQGKSGPALTAMTMAGQSISQLVNKLSAHQSQLSAGEVEALARLLTPTTSAPSPMTLTAPGAPSNLQAASSGNQTLLTWADNSDNESGFRIQRASDNSFSFDLITLTVGPSINNYADSSVTPGTTLYYRILAYNAAGDSAWSETASASTQTVITFPVAPSNLSAIASNGQIDLSWKDNSDNESGFRIQRSIDGGFGAGLMVINSGANTVGFSDTSISSGTTYYYRILAYNSFSDSNYSNTANAFTTATTIETATTPDVAQLYAQNCASCHGVNREGGYGPALTSSALSGRTSGQLVTKLMTHQSSQLTSAGISALASYLAPAAPPTTYTPMAPYALSAIASGIQIRLTWADVASNESGFRIERATDGVFSSGLTTLYSAAGTLGLTDVAVSPGVTYYYRICAYNSAGDSSWSEVAWATAQANSTIPIAPSNLAATANGGQINLSWTDNSNNESGFRLQRSTDSSFSAGLITLNSGANTVNFGDATVSTGTTYYYRSLAYNSIGDSTWSNMANVLVTSIVPDAAQLYAQNCASCHGVNREGGYGPVLTASALSGWTSSQLVTKLTGHQGSQLTSSGISSLATFLSSSAPMLPAAPTNLSATVIGSQVSLSWTDNSNNEDGFRVQRATDSGFGAGLTTLTSGAATVILNDTSVATGTIYYYRILAYNSAGDSAWSNVVSVSTPTLVTIPATPSNLIAVAVSTTQVNLTWTDNSNNEAGFRIQRSNSNNFGSGSVSTNIVNGSVSYADTGLSVNTTYYYRILANNMAGDSLWSNIANTSTPTPVTLPSAPSNLVAIAVSSNQVNLTWTDNSNNESNFSIQRATNSGFSAGLANMTAAGATKTYVDTSVGVGTPYYYRLRSVNTAGVSSWSNTVNVVTPAVVTTPAAPSNLAATAASSTRINLTWTDNSNNEVSFNIQRATNSGFSTSVTNMTTTAGLTTYSDTSVLQSAIYYYRVRATNTVGNSAWSNTANVSTTSTVIIPTAPSNLNAVAASGTQVNLMWTDNSNNETSFRLQRSTNSGFTSGLTNATATANLNTYSDASVASGTTYYFRILATNAVGDSAWSNVVSITTPAAVNAAQVYNQNCASCHGATRQGASGPSLTSTALVSRTISYLVSFIQGHKTGSSLTSTVVNALAAYLKNTP